MPNALIALCAIGAASMSFAPVAAYAAPSDPAVTVAVTRLCSAASSNASLSYASPVDMPAIAKEMGFSGTASIRIDIAPDGALVAARVAESSGNPWVDKAALAAARATTYRAATVDCAPVGGAYLLIADLRQ